MSILVLVQQITTLSDAISKQLKRYHNNPYALQKLAEFVERTARRTHRLSRLTYREDFEDTLLALQKSLEETQKFVQTFMDVITNRSVWGRLERFWNAGKYEKRIYVLRAEITELSHELNGGMSVQNLSNSERREAAEEEIRTKRSDEQWRMAQKEQSIMLSRSLAPLSEAEKQELTQQIAFLEGDMSALSLSTFSGATEEYMPRGRVAQAAPQHVTEFLLEERPSEQKMGANPIGEEQGHSLDWRIRGYMSTSTGATLGNNFPPFASLIRKDIKKYTKTQRLEAYQHYIKQLEELIELKAQIEDAGVQKKIKSLLELNDQLVVEQNIYRLKLDSLRAPNSSAMQGVIDNFIVGIETHVETYNFIGKQGCYTHVVAQISTLIADMNMHAERINPQSDNVHKSERITDLSEMLQSMSNYYQTKLRDSEATSELAVASEKKRAGNREEIKLSPSTRRTGHKYVSAQLNNLGLYKIQGTHHQKLDKTAGIYDLTTAAEQGDPHAMYNLGIVFEKGYTEDGIPDLIRALEWYTKVLRTHPDHSRAKQKIAMLESFFAECEDESTTANQTSRRNY